MNPQHSTLHAGARGNPGNGEDTLDSFERTIVEATEDLKRKGIVVTLPQRSERQSQPIARCGELFLSFSNSIEQIHADNLDLKRCHEQQQHNSSQDVEDRAMLAGMNATNSKLFRLRMLAALMSCISFAVMVTVPQAFNTDGMFHPCRRGNCSTLKVSGEPFSTVPYTAVFAVGVTVCVYSLVLCLYYLMPVNDNNQKQIPGLRWILEECMDRPDESDYLINSLGSCGCSWGGLVEARTDQFLSLACLAAFVLAAVALEQPASFHEYCVYKHLQQYEKTHIYYSLDTFYATFTSPGDRQCKSFKNPIPAIRASLAMLFFAMCAMMLCARRSQGMWKKEVEGDRQLVTSADNSSHAGESSEGLLAEGSDASHHPQTNALHAQASAEEGAPQLHDLAQQLHRALHSIGAPPRHLGSTGAPLGEDAQSCLFLLQVYLDAAAHVLEENRALKSQAAGEPASPKKEFWLRILAGVFSLISLTVMTTVPHLTDTLWHAKVSFFLNSYCVTENGRASFHMGPFFCVIAATGCVVLCTLVGVVCRLLPVDGDHHKYIPGMQAFTQDLLSRPHIGEALRGIYSYCVFHELWLRAMMDLFLSLLLLSAFVPAAVALDTPVRFWDHRDQPMYYSLVTYYATYSTGNYQCHTESPHAIPRMRASLAMLFFAWCAVVQSLRLSWRQWRAQAAAGRNGNSSGTGSGTCSGSASGIGGSRGDRIVEQMHALASLPAASNHSAGSAGSAEEEVKFTITFSGSSTGNGASGIPSNKKFLSRAADDEVGGSRDLEVGAEGGNGAQQPEEIDL